ncbi:MAG: ribosome biogenesis GTP-binding protein YihA/YsxC [Desulfobacteraceae bacterium]|nr:ribosome biogenesis GTP-binding protein YihA/YsxC [Desulfobacteraceae bacterium]
MHIRSAEFVKSAVKPVHYPPPDLPEIAFAGRSNVGKSSLINTLVRRKHLVKTSNTPGRTQHINFFRVNEELMLVDLPGYGYAKVPAAVRKQWRPMIEAYLSGRPVLRGLVLILDIRRTPGPEEISFLQWLKEQGVPAQLVVTKADKLSKSRQTLRKKAVAEALAAAPETMILFSAKTALGRDALWREILALVSAR